MKKIHYSVLSDKDVEPIAEFLENRKNEFEDVTRILAEDREWFVSGLRDEIARETAFGIVVREYDTEDGRNQIVGLGILGRNHTWWGPEPYLSNRLFYVVPTHRNHGIQNKLLDYFKRLADSWGLPLFLEFPREWVDPRLERWLKLQGCKSSGFQVTYKGSIGVV